MSKEEIDVQIDTWLLPVIMGEYEQTVRENEQEKIENIQTYIEDFVEENPEITVEEVKENLIEKLKDRYIDRAEIPSQTTEARWVIKAIKQDGQEQEK